MPRKYTNEDPKSPLEIIILTESNDDEIYPRVIYNIQKEVVTHHEDEKEKEAVYTNNDCSPIPLNDNITLMPANAPEYYVLKDQRRVGGHRYLLDYLCQAELISESFKQKVIMQEKAHYEAHMAEKFARKIYELPESDKGHIEAVIIQQHGDQPGVFIRYNEENRQTLFKFFEGTNMGMDGMFADFDNYSVLFFKDKKQSSVTEFLSGLCKLGLISKNFMRTVLAQESEIRVFSKRESRLNGDFDIEAFESKMKIRFDALEQQIKHYQSNASRVRYGEFHGQLPRQLRDIVIEFNKIKDHQIDTAKGLDAIIQHARSMGEQHPITIAAQKCQNLIMTITPEDQIKLGY